MGALDVSKGTVKSIYALGAKLGMVERGNGHEDCLLYTSPSPRDRTRSRMPSSA